MTIQSEKLARANQLLDERNLAQAESLLNELSDESQLIPGLWRSRGALEHLRGHHERALEYLGRAVDMDPADSMAFVWMGQTYRAIGDLALAEARLAHAIEIEPGRYEAHLMLALLIWAIGDHERAGVFFRNVLLLDVKSSHAHYYLGLLEFEGGEYGKAMEFFRSCLAIDARYEQGRVALAQVCYALGNTLDASREMRQVVEAGGVDREHIVDAARYQFELGFASEAASLLRTISDHAGSAIDEHRDVEPFLGRWCDIVQWCEGRDQEIARVARTQRHKVLGPRVLGATLDEMAYPNPITPDIFVVEISDCQLLPDGLVPMTLEGDAFFTRVMNDPLRRVFSNNHVVHIADDGRLLLWVPSKEIALELPAIYLGEQLDYGDWLMQCVSRMWAYAQRPGLEGLHVITNIGGNPWRRQILEYLGISVDRCVEVPKDARLICKTLHVATENAPAKFAAPFALEYLRRAVRAAVAPATNYPLRVFVYRREQLHRRLKNFDTLWPILERQGFQCIDPDQISLTVLMGLLIAAEAILGVEDDAMSNVFVAPARCVVGLISASESNAHRFATPSITLGQRFTFLIADVDYGSSDKLSECDIELDAKLVDEFLGSL